MMISRGDPAAILIGKIVDNIYRIADWWEQKVNRYAWVIVGFAVLYFGWHIVKYFAR